MNRTTSVVGLLFALTASFTACGHLPNRITISHGSSDDHFTRSFISRIGDKDIEFGLTGEDISRFPAWSPAMAPPLSVQEVAKIAEVELAKYTHGTQGWYAREVSIQQIHRAASGQDKWIYLVSFGGVGDEDYVQIPVSFSGIPVKGVEKPHEKRDD